MFSKSRKYVSGYLVGTHCQIERAARMVAIQYIIPFNSILSYSTKQVIIEIWFRSLIVRMLWLGE